MSSKAIDLDVGAHISGSTTAVVLRWVRGQVGDDGVARMLADAGERRPAHVLEDVAEWSSYRQATALLESAVRVTRRADAARRIGEEMLAQHRGTAVADLLRSLGSPEALLHSVTEAASKFSTVFRVTAEHVSRERATVVGMTPTGVPRHRLLCDLTTGLLSIVPTVFDLPPAVVTQSECQARGGARCVYLLHWDAEGDAAQSPGEQRIRLLENDIEAAQMHLNALRATAEDVVTARDVATALGMVMRRAGTAVRAPQYLLAVSMPGEARLRVHCSGLSQQAAEELAPTLLEAVSEPSVLLVDIASGARRYGVLAALYPNEVPVFQQELDVLSSFANYAASALDTAWAIEDARRQAHTARVLLDLSRSLAGVAAPEDVAQRLAAAVPAVVGCDSSTVLLWDEARQRLMLAASENVAPDGVTFLTDVGVGLADTPALTAMLAQPAPLFMDRDHGDAYLRGLLHRTGSAAAVVVPILGGGRFLGVVTAGMAPGAVSLERSSDLLERLEGLAHQAAVALTNARLVDELQRQARHDPLTGLANRAALMEALEQAVRREDRNGGGCALLFLDLDRFKQVNDTLGHAAGDQLLTQFAERVVGAVRAEDLVARLGGDEFAVLMPLAAGPGEASVVADRILASVSEPFVLAAGVRAAVGVSIGICVGAARTLTGVDVMREADAAMYRAKAAGGGRLRWPGSSPVAPRAPLPAELTV